MKTELDSANEEIGRLMRDLTDTAKQYDDKCDEIERLWRIIIEGLVPRLRVYPLSSVIGAEEALHNRAMDALEDTFMLKRFEKP